MLPVLRIEKKIPRKRGVNRPPPPLPAPLFVKPPFGDVAVKTAAPECRGERGWWWW